MVSDTEARILFYSTDHSFQCFRDVVIFRTVTHKTHEMQVTAGVQNSLRLTKTFFSCIKHKALIKFVMQRVPHNDTSDSSSISHQGEKIHMHALRK